MYIFKPATRNYDLNAVPADPSVMEACLRARLMAPPPSRKHCSRPQRDPHLHPDTGSDPCRLNPDARRRRRSDRHRGHHRSEGRPATKDAFVDKQHRAGIVNAIYVDPATTQGVAELRTQNGQPLDTCIYTERRIVPSLPNDIIETLGAHWVEKSIP